ncbi:MAG: hypothetical protein EOM59_07395 [Clostridia bacterium]|nr:hypothetical protein [Clostridia bacterium]
MLNLYYGRESLDKEAFLFYKIKESLKAIRTGNEKAKRVLLIVPAQFTLKAEEAAFYHLKERGFFDLDIMSGNRLRSRILNEVGQTGKIPIDSLGRKMLLRKIATEKKEELYTFTKVVESDEFLSMTGDFIVQLKQNNLSPQDLKKIAEKTGDSVMLKKKLEDMHVLYMAYQAVLQGKFNDSEDLLNDISQKVQKSNFIATSEIWYYDFYSFVPSEIGFMRELIKHSTGLNVLMTKGEANDNDRAIFAPVERSIKDLTYAAKSVGIDFSIIPVHQEFAHTGKPAALLHLEHQLFAMPCRTFHKEDKSLPVHMLRASNPYTESETIASQIKVLVQDKGYAYSDIAVLTNDIKQRGAVLSRVFTIDEIPCFVDEKRTLLHNSLIKKITALLNIVSDCFRAEDVLQFIKSESSFADTEDFENYVIQYHIKSNRFLSPFKYGSKVFGEEKMRHIEKLRQKLENIILPFKESLLAAASVKEKSTILYSFLAQTLKVPDALAIQTLALSEAGMVDAAEETQQVWGVFLELLDQMVELIGDEHLPISAYRDLLEASFSDIKVGLLPQEEHKVLIGTIGRSRLSNIKALFIAGVNDGVLPADLSGEGLLTERELSVLEEQGYTLSKSNVRKQEEERLVIYKVFSKPAEELFISYSVADAEGNEIKPSSLVTQMFSMFPSLCEEPDIENAESEIGFIQSRYALTAHLSSALRKVLSAEESSLSPVLRQGYNTLLNMKEERLQMIKQGLFFVNKTPPLTPKTTMELYRNTEIENNFSFSPSRLEKFAGCPFMHYVSYGLKPTERKSFEISGSEIGDIHHECMMRLSRDLSNETESLGLRVSDPKSPWMTITRDACQARMDRIVSAIVEEKFEGLLQAGKEEEYRTKRVTEVSGKFAWKMIEHVRKGNIDRIFSEAEFNSQPEASFPAVEVSTGLHKVLIEGKIDRVDILGPHPDEPYVKIIDYKSGHVTFDKKKVQKGLNLQLMIYLEGALGYKSYARPAGVFYYHVEDPRLSARLNEMTAEIVSDDLLKTIEKQYQMDGLFINEPVIVQSIDSSIEKDSSSTVLSASNKNGEYVSSKAMTSEEFEEFRTHFKEKLNKLCKDILDGSITAEPRRIDKSTTACTYCPYSSICFFDPSFSE